MSDDTQKSSEDEKFTLQKEVWGLIDEYLEVSNRVSFSSENIAAWVYIFLGGEWYKENLHNYPYAAGKALSALASKQELRQGLEKFMGENEYLNFCQLLHNMIELCTIITKLEPNMVKLEKEAYEEGWISDRMSVEELKIEKEMYKLRLERIKVASKR